MENEKHNRALDELIRESMEILDMPSPELNARLKMDIYRRENSLQQEKNIRSISFWYVPMVLSFFTFALLAATSLIMISNPYLSIFLAFMCGYMAIAIMLITMIGVKRTDIKNDMKLRIRKEEISHEQ